MSQYIGKTISLVSNSDIKYVGTLHEINSEQSTVSLKNVRSYGTEGRRGGNNEIPPSDSVYEFIVFRGSDVKDLKIAETAPPPPVQSFQDPAIIQSTNNYGQQQPAGPSYPNYTSSSGPSSTTASQATTIGAPKPAPVAAPVTAPAANTQKGTTGSTGVTPSGPQNYRNQSPPPALPIGAPGSSATSVVQKPPVPQSAPAAPAATANRTNQSRTSGPVAKTKLPEFNFDESNAKFSKEAVSNEESVIPKASAEEFYDRKSSFFDNISSTSKERLEGNENKTAYQRRGEERQLNMETFGQAEAHHHNNWRGGRGGRGRGRGGYRGRGQSNNNWRGGRGGRGGFNDFNNNNNNATTNNEPSTTI